MGVPDPPPLTVSRCPREPSLDRRTSRITASPGRFFSVSEVTITAPAPSPKSTQVRRSAQLVREVNTSQAHTRT